jgi:oligopeptidase A
LNKTPADNPLLRVDGLPDFAAIRPEFVQPAVEATLATNRAELDALLDATADSAAPAFADSVGRVEAIGDRLHRIWAPVRHLHSVANTPALRDAYNACLPSISRYETELGHNRRLFQLYERLAAQGIDGPEGAQRLLQLAVRDFRLAGVHLTDDRKERFRQVMEELAQAEATFEQNMLDSAAAWSLHVTAPEKVSGLPALVLEPAAARARERGLDGWCFELTQPTYVAVVSYADDADLRYRLYRAWVTRASDQADYSPGHDNSAVMERILALRHEAAALVGFASYAEYSLATRMASSVDEVRAFLEKLAEHALPAARRELAELESFAGRKLEPWDIAYYSEKLRHHRYAISDEQLRPYFPLPRVLEGLFAVVRQLYGIRIVAADGIARWDPNVSYYRLVDEAGTEVGGFYVDFFARQSKRSGAWMDQALNRMRTPAGIQKPVAHLVCNYALPTAESPSLLTHDEVVTLFHEMGHVLHHLLTRIDYPSIAGINGVPWDAVELPSQFMETFAWEPAVVSMESGHYQTGEPLPGTVLASLRESRNFQAALQLARQLEFSVFDLRLHAEYDPARGGRVMQLLNDVRQRYAVVPAPGWNRFAHSFSHIFAGGYAAGYYSYKWAEVLAADAFEAFEEGGLWNAELSGRFRRCVLEVGGSRDIAEAYVAFRGRPAHVDALLRQCGIEP